MNTVRIVVAGIVAVGLAGCGASEIASPGSGGNITINNPPAVIPPTPEPTPPDLATPAGGCPTALVDTGVLTDRGTISGPTGEYRVCELAPVVTSSVTLPRFPGLLYSMNGRVDVGNDCGPSPAAACSSVTLTIDPGVIIFANTGVSWLAVNRGHKINAVGTAARPIVFTSRDNVLGQVSDDSQGQWGGVVLHGRARTTDCTAAPTPCQRQTEGAVDPAVFGGLTDDDNSGVLRYVQIRYSGYVLSGNSELQSLTLGATGSGTDISYIQSFNSSDDGFEIFGGTTSLNHIVVIGADDDSADVDTGYTGTIQYLLAVQKTSGAADSVIELDSPAANPTTDERQVPRTHLKLANFTLVHRNPASGNGAAMRFRGSADVTLLNGIVTTPMAALRIDNTPGQPDFLDPAEVPPLFQSVVLTSGAAGGAFVNGSGGVTAAQVATLFNTPGNNTSATFVSTLTNGFVNGTNETNHPVTDGTSLGFAPTTHIGAVATGDTWHTGWTCNSSWANLGGSSACTSLPSLAD